jgi:hypothetical protein
VGKDYELVMEVAIKVVEGIREPKSEYLERIKAA